MGTDHPCQAVCSVTGIEIAIYKADPDTLEPEADAFHTATIDLNITKTFNWSGNATSIVWFDLNEGQAEVPLPAMHQNFWCVLG